jgi:hypothetical protein
MSNSAKREYLKVIHPRYQESNKLKKSQILDEFCLVFGVTRKHAIKLLNKPLLTRRRHKGPKIKYNPGLLTAPLTYLWKMMGRANSKKMRAGMAEWLKYSGSSDQAHLFTEEVKALLQNVSASSIERMLRRIRWRDQRGKSSTRPNKHFMKQIHAGM